MVEVGGSDAGQPASWASKDFLKVQKPEDITASALGEMDFKKKLAVFSSMEISMITARQNHDIFLAFQHEHQSLIEGAYRRGFDRREDFKREWDQFNQVAESPIYAGMKAASDESFNGFSEAYFYSLQALTGMAWYAERLASAILTAYSKNSGMSEDEKKQFIGDARQLAAVAERMGGMARSLESKKV